MGTHEIATAGMEKDEEAGGISKGDQLGLFGVELQAQSLKIADSFANRWQAIDTPSEVLIELWTMSTLRP